MEEFCKDCNKPSSSKNAENFLTNQALRLSATLRCAIIKYD
jgi:hypothetical protein